MPVRSVLHLCTKFEADSSCCIRSQLTSVGSKENQNESRDSGHAQLRDTLHSLCRPGPSAIVATNLKRIAQLVRITDGDPTIGALGQVITATSSSWWVCGPYAGKLRPLCLYQIWNGQLLPFEKWLRGPKVRQAGDYVQGSRDGRNFISCRWSLP